MPPLQHFDLPVDLDEAVSSHSTNSVTDEQISQGLSFGID